MSFGDPIRQMFEPGDTVSYNGRCGLALELIGPGILIEWWDGTRNWLEVSTVENVTTGLAPTPIPVSDETIAGLQSALLR